MTEKRQRMISAMKYILLVIIVGYLVILMLYASGSKRAFSEVSKALSSVLDSKELVQMDDQMLKRNYGLNSADYKGVLYYSSPSSISAAEVLVIQVKNDAQIENVTNAIAQRKAQRIEDFDSYLPEQVKLFVEDISFLQYLRKLLNIAAHLTRVCRRGSRCYLVVLHFCFYFCRSCWQFIILHRRNGRISCCLQAV